MEQNKTEIILHTTDGSTMQINTSLQKEEVSHALMVTTGFNNLVNLGIDEKGNNVIINMNNVCFISLTDLGGEDGDKGVD